MSYPHGGLFESTVAIHEVGWDLSENADGRQESPQWKVFRQHQGRVKGDVEPNKEWRQPVEKELTWAEF